MAIPIPASKRGIAPITKPKLTTLASKEIALAVATMATECDHNFKAIGEDMEDIHASLKRIEKHLRIRG